MKKYFSKIFDPTLYDRRLMSTITGSLVVTPCRLILAGPVGPAFFLKGSS